MVPLNEWDTREVCFFIRLEDRNVLSFVIEVCPKPIIWFLGFKIGVNVFPTIEEGSLRGF
jgi:hypothetical protein